MPLPQRPSFAAWTKAEIEAALKAGDRFVVHPFALGFVIAALYRESAPRRIPAGSSALGSGLPFAFLTLVLGWWALPRGPWFAIRALYVTLRGGRDVTAEAAEFAGAPRPSTASSPLGLPRFAAGLAAALAFPAAVLVLLGAIAGVRSRSARWAVVNGSDSAYTATFDGEEFRLDAGGARTFLRPAGSVRVSTSLPGAGSSVTASSPAFWEYLRRNPLTVVNPDAVAVLRIDQTDYAVAEEGDTRARDEYPVVGAFAGRQVHILREVDFAFSEFPQSLAVRAWEASTRTRVVVDFDTSVSDRFRLLQRAGPQGEPVRFLAARLAINPGEAPSLRIAAEELSVADANAVFGPHLQTRPPSIPLHLAFQRFCRLRDPGQDLAARYRALDDGSPETSFLLAMALDDAAAALEFARKATSGDGAIEDAWVRRAQLALHLGLVPEAVEASRAALAIDPFSSGGLVYSRLARIAADNPETWLADVRRRLADNPTDVDAAGDLIFLLARLGRRGEVMPAAQQFLGRALPLLPGQAVPGVQSTITTHALYLSGNRRGAAEAASRVPGAEYQLMAAGLKRTTGDLDIVALQQPAMRAQSILLRTLLVGRDGRGDAVDAARASLEDLRATPFIFPGQGTVAAFIANPTPEAAAAVTAQPLDPVLRRLVLASLAVAYPAHRGILVPAARAANLSPIFPHDEIAESLDAISTEG